MKIKRTIAIASILALICVGCVTNYYKLFGIGQGQYIMTHVIDFRDFTFGLDIDVIVNKDNFKDSVYSIHVWTRRSDILVESQKERFLSMRLLEATVEFDDGINSLTLDSVATNAININSVEYSYTYIFDDLMIPNSIDSIKFGVFISYEENSQAVFADTSIQMIRIEGKRIEAVAY